MMHRTGEKHSVKRRSGRYLHRIGCDAWGRDAAGCIAAGADTSLAGPVTVPEAALGVGGALGLLGLILGAPLWGALLLGAGAAGATKVAIDKVTA